jgi:hypothetical protein
MKKNLLFLLLLLIATSCATQKTISSNVECIVPIYYNGNDEPIAAGVFLYSEEQ